MKEFAKIESARDVVAFLKEQHQQIKSLFSRVLTTRGKQRQQAFFDLRRLIAVHETAEEEIVHPAAKRARGVGEAVVAARLREENEGKKTLTELEGLHTESAEFETLFREFEKAVLAHANAEEVQEFDKLAPTFARVASRRARRAS
jgi:hemerythrin superfamily protein